MGFLVPSALILGGVLALAILATYLLRPRRPTRRVSSTLLWLAAFHDLQAHRPWRRLPPTLLLALQLLGLLGIIGAFARPYVLSADAAGLEAVVLLDVSASMQATDIRPSRFEAARAQVQSMIDGLQPGESLALVSLGAEPRVAAPQTGDKAVLARALADLQPTAESANLPAALSLAAGLASGHPDAQIIVVGDGSLDRSQVPQGLPAPLRFIPIGTSTDNLAVAAFGTRSLDGHLVALASVANYGSQRHGATLELLVDGQRFDLRLLDVDPGQTADARWDDIPASAHVLEARLAEPDALALDNAAWTLLGDDRPTRVVLVSDANLFLEEALGLRPGVQVDHVLPDDYAPETNVADLTVFDGVLPPTLPARGSLLLVHPPAGSGLLPVHEDVAVPSLSAARAGDPLLEDVPLDSVHVNRARRLDVPAWADVVLDSPATPLLLNGDTGGQRVAVLGFDVHQSDLPLQPGFPVLMQHLLDWLVPSSSVATPVVRVGEAATIVPLPEATSVDVVTPSGADVQVAPPFPPTAFSDTQTPGIYRIIQRDARGQATESQFAVNFQNPRESHVAPGTPANTAAPTATARQAQAQAAQQRAPREVWVGLALFGFVILGLEWWAFHRQ